MRIGLIDVDGHSGFPNLALMKLSAWHKNRGDSVEWYYPIEHDEKHPLDRVYMSKVFTFTPDYEPIVYAKEIITGGTGYKNYGALPEEIEKTFPDYSIYPNVDYAVGFLTRGCIRHCPWCIVPTKEGKLHAADTWKEIRRPDSKKIVFLDNNVLASDHGLRQMQSMVGQNIRIDFNQGMDARLVDRDVAELLGRLKWIRFIRFSSDTEEMIPVIERAVELLKKEEIPPSKVFVYALIQDVQEAHRRIVALDKLGVDVFAQPYIDFNGGKPTEEQKRLARWCNMKAAFHSCTFEEFTR